MILRFRFLKLDGRIVLSNKLGIESIKSMRGREAEKKDFKMNKFSNEQI
jgi:hypothetical protein